MLGDGISILLKGNRIFGNEIVRIGEIQLDLRRKVNYEIVHFIKEPLLFFLCYNRSGDYMKKEKDTKWILSITIIAFVISFIFSLVAELVIPNAFIVISIFLVFIFIFLGIIFDIIGVAISVSDQKSFHSMATKRVNGAKTAIKLTNNREKVSSFCNDVIGDICGVISGSCGLSIAIKLSSIFSFNLLITTLIITSIISAITIGGKALGKKTAIKNSNKIVYEFSKIISPFTK